MDYTMIDAHAHLWLRQDTVVNGQQILTLENGKSLFMGEIRQKFFIEHGLCPGIGSRHHSGIYRRRSKRLFMGSSAKYPTVFSVAVWSMFARKGIGTCTSTHRKRVQGIKLPANRFSLPEGRISMTTDEMMQMFKLMEENGVFLSIDLEEEHHRLAR